MGENKVAIIIHKIRNASVSVETWWTRDEKNKWKLDEYPIIYVDCTVKLKEK